MRLLSIIAGICIVAGCTRTISEPASVDPTSPPSVPVPQPTPAATGLYTDEEIRKLANFDIDKEPDGTRSIPWLDVVPAGESYPREKVFKMLKIDDKRIRDFRHGGINSVNFLTWQVSPSFDICCMTATNDPRNDDLEMTDPKRKVYGIRLIKRHK
jgi:hypothetical protein